MLVSVTRHKALWLVFLLMLAVLGKNALEQYPRLMAADLPNPDSYYKLVMVRDHVPETGFNFVARDNAPHGVWMHWSLPHTWSVWALHQGLMALGMEQQPALLVAGGGLTVLCMLALVLLLALSTANAGSPKAAIVTALVVASSPPLFAYGQLLQVTHHIFMLVPVAAAAACFLRPDLRAGWLADFVGGALLGLALWISPETMPLVVTMAGMRAAIRLQHPFSGSVWPVALGLMLMLSTGWLIDPPPPTFTAWALDHISYTWVLLGAMVAALLLYADGCVARAVGLGRSVGELALMTLLLGACWLWLVPGAILGADGLIPPYLHDIWYSRIQELQPAATPTRWLGYLLFPALGGVLLLVVAWRQRSLWVFVLAASTLAYAVLVSEHIRMGAAGSMLSALAFGIGLSRLRAFEHMHDKSQPMREQLLVALLILAVPLRIFGVVGLAHSENKDDAMEGRADACHFDDALPLLGVLPAGIVLAESNLGAEILFKTHHMIVAGNYHHNVDGLLDDFHMLRDVAPDSTARRLADSRGVDYVLVCSEVGRGLKRGKYERTLAQRLASAEPVDWLPRHEAVGNWRVYLRIRERVRE